MNGTSCCICLAGRSPLVGTLIASTSSEHPSISCSEIDILHRKTSVNAMHATLRSPVVVVSHISKPRTVSPAPPKAAMVGDGCSRRCRADVSTLCDQHDCPDPDCFVCCSCRGALTASGAALLLLISPGSAYAVNLKDAKRR